MSEVTNNGTTYRWHGSEHAPVMVLIHGLGVPNTWDQHVPVFAEHYRILTYDLYGHGQSANPPRVPDLTLYAEQLAVLLDELRIETAPLVGFSLGGMINRRFAMNYPDRVSALAILNSPHERTPEAQQLVEQRAADTGAGGPGATLDATIERWFTPTFREGRDDVIQQVRNWVLANDTDSYTKCRQVLASGVIELIRPKPPITHPTLVMTCENDTGSTPEMSHAIGSEISGSRVIVVPQLQHMGLVERPALFTGPILAFLHETLANKAN